MIIQEWNMNLQIISNEKSIAWVIIDIASL